MTTALRTDDSGNTGAISFKGVDLITLATPGATLTGVPKAPTATPGANTTQIATTEFVYEAVASVVASNPTPSNAVPQADAAAGSPGVAILYSRSDHVHPQFTSPSNSPPLVASGAGNSGTSANFSRADHVHPTQPGASPSDANPAAPGAAAPGTSALYSRGDHVHPAQTVPTASNATPQPLGTATPGISPDFSRADHVHVQSILPSSTLPLVDAASAAVGTGTTYARNDHVHPKFTTAATTLPLVPSAAGAIGTSNDYARADHQHPAGAQSLSTNGYATLPGGLIMQWGTNVFTPAGSAISFPIAFPNAVYGVTLGILDSSNPPTAVAAVNPPTLLGFTGHCSASYNVCWTAIGR